ncbi:collagen alpha chain-like [Acropora millepora]|uniref:collagen alpha chain-like n=1 Tax=Acropora millepora TaxID=45264 RepID=UPI001CF1E1D8|nr:collagen alpha chain-like [Acropora millepora]
MEGFKGRPGDPGKPGPRGPTGFDGRPGHPGKHLFRPPSNVGTAEKGPQLGKLRLYSSNQEYAADTNGDEYHEEKLIIRGSLSQLLGLEFNVFPINCNFDFYHLDRAAKKNEEAFDFWLRGLDFVVANYKRQNGTRQYPARSCRELHLDYPQYPSGRYWIDPNEGCINDALFVYCDFQKQANCIDPKKNKIVVPELSTRMWISQSDESAPIMDYKAPAIQMNFLRLLTKQVFQNITYSCYQESENDCTIQLQGENEVELQSYETTKPKFVNESSQKKELASGNQAVVEINTKRKEALPIMDVAPTLVGNLPQEFILEIGPVCFMY